MFKSIHGFASCMAAIVAGLISSAAIAGEDFPLTGNYTQNVACKGDGTDPEMAKVKVTPKEIVSNVGVCTILDAKKVGAGFFVHVQCNFAGGPLMGDITFTPRPDNTVESIDRDGNYKAILYPCPR